MQTGYQTNKNVNILIKAYSLAMSKQGKKKSNLVDFAKASATKTFNLPPHILLVEDEPISLSVIKDSLTKLGCHIDVATTGKQAIAMYAKGYDLILLDIGLPDISGLGVCMAIRSQEQDTHTPIIAITAQESVIKDECLAVGADEFINKPLTLKQCEGILNRWISSIKN